jgi:beta-phosphoglucomutase
LVVKVWKEVLGMTEVLGVDRHGRAITARAAIFDLNGTIVLDEHLLAGVVSDVLAEVGVAVSTAEYFACYAGLSDEPLFHRALARAGLSPADGRIESLIDRRVELYLARSRTVPAPLRPGVVALIERLGAAMPLAVASNALRCEVEEILEHAGLRDAFSAVVGVDDVERGKPDPAMFRVALAELNEAIDPPVVAHETAVLEDSPTGVRAARAAGMRCIALAGTVAASLLAEADLVVHDIERELFATS